MTGISAFQSIDESSWFLWFPGFKNRLMNGNSGFLLFECFDFIVYLLIVVTKDREHRIHYYFL